jgi:hypothetical protein
MESASAPRFLPRARVFVVQFYDQPPETSLAWEGRIEHLVSGQMAHFHSSEALLAFLRRILTEVPASPDAG